MNKAYQSLYCPSKYWKFIVVVEVEREWYDENNVKCGDHFELYSYDPESVVSNNYELLNTETLDGTTIFLVLREEQTH